MRRTIYIYPVLLGIMLMFSGCIEDDLSGAPHTGDPDTGELAAVRLTAIVSPQDESQGGSEASITRAGTSIQSTQFDNGETFYAYFATAGVRIGNVVGNNTTYTTDGWAMQPLPRSLISLLPSPLSMCMPITPRRLLTAPRRSLSCRIRPQRPTISRAT